MQPIKQNKIKTTVMVLLFCVFISSAGPVRAEISQAEPALLYFNVDKSSYLDPDHLYIDIMLAAGANSYNLFDLNVAYDPSLIRLASTSISRNCPLVLKERIGLLPGLYSLACGAPAPLSGQAPIARLEFDKIAGGYAKINFSRAGVFLADGRGTAGAVLTEGHNIFVIK